MNDDASIRVVEQRVRNRIIEYFSTVGSADEQQRYERTAPPYVNIPRELINQWEDRVPTDPRSSRYEPLSTLSQDEIQALREYQEAWERAAAAVPETLSSLAEVQELPAWRNLTQSAAGAAAVFARRGLLPEDLEVHRRNRPLVSGATRPAGGWARS